MLFLFWDIDGTLLTTGRAGIFAWEDAAKEVLGRDVDLAQLGTAGLTDVEIGGRILGQHGLEPTGERVARIVGLYENYLPRSLPRRRGRVLPNVREILASVARRDDVWSALLTGNTRAGAQAKLSHYGLAEFFAGGAFADGRADRTSIARHAVEMVRGAGHDPAPERTYVIGDTPHDIDCAKAIGARPIAVATGAYARAELDALGAWWALDALPEPQAFLARLEAP